MYAIRSYYDINDPKTHDDAIRIMASRVGLEPQEYESFVQGTKILTLDEAKQVYKQGSGFDSIYGSSQISDDFNVANKVYDSAQNVTDYIDSSVTDAL